MSTLYRKPPLSVKHQPGCSRVVGDRSDSGTLLDLEVSFQYELIREQVPRLWKELGSKFQTVIQSTAVQVRICG
jgi:hypothetical protein